MSSREHLLAAAAQLLAVAAWNNMPSGARLELHAIAATIRRSVAAQRNPRDEHAPKGQAVRT